VGLLWGVHMHAHLLDDVSNVGPIEGKVLERTGEAPVGRRERRSGARRRPEKW
jgi:hypothetical protein